MKKNLVRKKAHVDTKYCVACGICAKNCPVKAISINKGMYAKIDLNKCVGCTKCSMVCPASVIEMKQEV
ncbi:4Fe-4S dicluster domain-containing protein [Clostridium taeniosporum]|uniref:4Fe-4S ferredoxin n=1 Tax=Clostridium taeniosporum TaxID=394958 RepID=A0A1D7XK12_9CLOT|nr:4Fe-4S dicluster domain-containing protein [Clostridium taeniosporum]AOR23655.1 4Fe-4S ferredoxin [Clostridium taeniosporum]